MTSTCCSDQPSPSPASLQADTEPLTFTPPLYTQRHLLVKSVLERYGCTRVLEAGCGDGAVLAYVSRSNLKAHSLAYVAGLDCDALVLDRAAKRLTVAEDGLTRGALTPLVVDVVLADLTCMPPPPPPPPPTSSQSRRGDLSDTVRPALLDAVLSIEVLEHVVPEKVAAYTDTIFAQLAAHRGARLVLLTTPNRDTNDRCPPSRAIDPTADPNVSIYSPTTHTPWRRHPDHKFELTARQFRCYCDYILDTFTPYWTHYELLGLEDHFTQGALFFSQTTVAKDNITGSLTPPRALAEATDDAAEDAVSTKTADGAPTSCLFDSPCVRWRWAREARLARFPFAQIFGLDPALYRTHWPTASSPWDGPAPLSAAGLYTPVASFTRPGRGLWERLGASTLHCLRAARATGAPTRPPRSCLTFGVALAKDRLWEVDGLWLTSPRALCEAIDQQKIGSARRFRQPRAHPPGSSPSHTDPARVRRRLLTWLRAAVTHALVPPGTTDVTCVSTDDSANCFGRFTVALQRVILFVALTDALPSAAAWLDAHRADVQSILAAHASATRSRGHPSSVKETVGTAARQKQHRRACHRLAAVFDAFTAPDL